MSSSTFWHNRLKLSGELAKLEDPGARVVPLTRAAGFVNDVAWYMLTVALVSGKDVVQLLLGAADDNNQRMILAHLLRHAPLPALLALGISIVAGWTSFRLLLHNDNTFGGAGCCASCISMVLNLLIALTSDCADIELQLRRD
ncbi:hypothetical protein PTSG_02832 [Salpingoeca rosetta]|uniref:Uncharacterized protein n=1 Tax=Salpingoeca rosetta (strain ATCC 50818 / BSB-021) TaxID=946362 RepID=F2U3G5_SALR5|nr:uncharacterized protein PTSG_02832 [Salpingoeca rosetta]EGD82159.1 hypothetical protein PTSG_02832 [Salpingoeca rosetta]|eukprot:XP_004996342.1 hypothetical protein PTSG_02832 [Salpingoeca rosetta]